MKTLLPFLFSILIPGAGQLYLRDYWKGIVMIFLPLFVGFIIPFIPFSILFTGTMIWSEIDIYLKTEKTEGKSKATKNLVFSFVIMIFIIPAIFYLSLFSFSVGGKYASDHFFNQNHTEREMKEIANQLDKYYHKYKRYPSDFETYVRSKPIWLGWLTDGWENKYSYLQTDSIHYTLISAGEDRKFGTTDDLINK
ncbi:MAG TPA: type II secretion system protein GspG [Chryseolinea sp.]|nr:type II secretion system protein GspG [Chryseolinea sp.]